MHDGYWGRLLKRIGLGCTIRDFERLVGPVREVNADNHEIAGVPGLCFDVALGGRPRAG